MEAMTAVSISLLTIYDMCKGIDKGMIIRNVDFQKKRVVHLGHGENSFSVL